MKMLALCLLAAIGGCFSPTLGDGHLRCAANGVCPPGFYCAADQTCWKNGDAPTPSPDMAMGPPTSYPASAVWTSCGGGEGASASGTRLNLSIGGSLAGGRSTAMSGADVTYGFFGDQLY